MATVSELTSKNIASTQANVQTWGNVLLNVKVYGAKGDGVTDNITAFENLAAYVNGLDYKPTIYFPDGEYLYSGGLHFTREVMLLSNNAILNYTGTGKAIELGPTDITVDNFQDHKHYEVVGLNFTGGANMTDGIYFNKFITQARVLYCTFENWGNATAYGLYFGLESWDAVVQGCQWDATNDSIARKFIGMAGQGNSRVRLLDNLIASLVGIGTAIYLNGFNHIVSRNKIEGFETAIRLGGLCSNARIIDNYFEKAGTPTGMIEIGSLSGDTGDATTPVGIFIKGNYANTRLRIAEPNTYFIKPTKATDLIKDITVAENYINAWNDDGLKNELVFQNNIGAQTGNRVYGNRLLNIDKINTIGVNILGWDGNQGIRREYSPISDEDRYDDTFMGKTENNLTGRRIRKFDGGVAYQEIVDTSFNTTISVSGKTMMKFYSDGRISFGKATVDASADFVADVKAVYFRIASQKTAASVENGSIFEGTDGKLYYKNLAGTVTDLTL